MSSIILKLILAGNINAVERNQATKLNALNHTQMGLKGDAIRTVRKLKYSAKRYNLQV